MVATHTGHVCRSLLVSLQSAAPFNARSSARAVRNRNVRNYSRTSIAYAATNYARPTTTARTASTASAAKASTAPAAQKPASAAVKSSTTPPKPTPAQPSQAYAPAADLTSPKTVRSLVQGLSDEPVPPAPPVDDTGNTVDWSSSFHGLSGAAFSKEAQDTLLEPVAPSDVEIKPDGIVYLPEIKYRRILNKAFGPGAWGLAPRGETIVTPKTVTREYGLVVHGRLVSIARGEQQYFDPEGIPTASEGCKSNALMRCCKDLGIASELWDPVFIRSFLANHSKEVWVEHISTKKTKKIIMRKDVNKIPYPFKEKAA